MRIVFFAGLVMFLFGCSISKETIESQQANEAMAKELTRLETIEEDYLILREEYAKLKKKSYATEKGLRDLVYRYDSLNQAFYALNDSGKELISTSINESNLQNERLLQRIQMLQQKVWDLEMQLDENYVIETGKPVLTNRPDSNNMNRNNPSTLEFNEDLVEVIGKHLNDPVTLITEGRTAILRIPSDYLIQGNQLSAEGGKLIFNLAKFMKTYRQRHIEVIGHTDAQGAPNQNWEESLRQAIIVVKAMINGGCNPLNIKASGKGHYDELVTNDTEENRSINRRIEIVISESD